MNGTVRAASDADGVVDQMRQLVQRGKPALEVEDRDQVERIVSTRIATVLMVLLMMIIFVTSAVPDVGPSLAKVIEAHL
jgi:hypothetical protein